MGDFLNMNHESKSKRDERFTIILIIGYIFLFLFFMQRVLYDNREILVQKSYDLQADLMQFDSIIDDRQGRASTYSIPAEFSPFFFEKMDINEAGKELLMTIKGIGPKLADSILQSRLEYGPFTKVEDLLKIKGVGSKRAKYFETLFVFGREK
ncbi:MAG: hypothetical protein BA873_07460 [Desulfobulbaceae bacterium C00003063]|nr:MAG: hypothetical protein BA873_07460 [Desulfobulbaceae bacterium C00003063]